jgi:hypothetical protein
MSRVDSFPSDALQEFSVDVVDWLEASELPTVGIEPSAPPIPIWDVAPRSSLSEAASDSGEWHHQIRSAKGVVAYARSRIVDGHAKIIALSESPLAESLEEALATVRDAPDGSATLRLLRSERHHTTCLWIHRKGGSDELIVLQSQALRVGERLDERSFLARLASLPPPGMIASAPRESRYRDVELWGENRAKPVRQIEL